MVKTIPKMGNRIAPPFISWMTESVVATGGGLPCFHNNMELFNDSGVTVYLRLSPEIIFSSAFESRKGNDHLSAGYNDEE